MDHPKVLQSIDKKLSALIALSARIVFKEDKEEKPEVVLSAAGLENTEIAKILGKALPAVQKTLQRAKRK